MNPALVEAAWPLGGAAEAMAELARRSGWRTRAATDDTSLAAPAEAGGMDAGRWIESTARWLDLDTEPVDAAYSDLDSMLRDAAPCLLRLPGAGPARFVAVLRGGRRDLRVVTPERVVVRVPLADARAALCADRERPVADEVDRLLDSAGLAGKRRARTREALVAERLSGERFGGCWLVRPGSGAGSLAHLGGRGFVARAGRLLAAHGVQHALFIGSWWLMGWMALADRFDPGWLALWLLMFAVLLPLRLFTFTAGGHLSIDVSTHLKQQLLRGAFKLHPDEVRKQGSGQLLGRTLETEAIESFTFVGALLTVTAMIELIFAGLILRAGAAGAGHTLMLALWTALMAGIALVYFGRRATWTDHRLDLTNGLVEQMVGHRTRMVQEPRRQWNQREDRSLERYHDVANRQDSWEVALDALVPRGWFLVGMLGLVPAFVAGGHSAAGVAAGIGGVLLAQRAFRGLASGIEQLAGAAVAWRRIQPLLDARQRPEAPGLPALAAPGTGTTRRSDAAEEPEAFRSVRPLLDARGLGFRYPGRSEPTLEGADLDVFSGDRVLLEGPSGGGKSTLARLLAAFERPGSGVVLLEGMDPATLGVREWRRRVVFVPQFHDNHVLIGSFAYNLLLGRAWPASQPELREAESVCRALGLGPLLDRMPGGLFQMVGETGWQLSHGERSRLFLARVLLQKPDIMILDESFAALDPHSLRSVQETLLAGDASVVLIAHP